MNLRINKVQLRKSWPIVLLTMLIFFMLGTTALTLMKIKKTQSSVAKQEPKTILQKIEQFLAPPLETPEIVYKTEVLPPDQIYVTASPLAQITTVTSDGSTVTSSPTAIPTNSAAIATARASSTSSPIATQRTTAPTAVSTPSPAPTLPPAGTSPIANLDSNDDVVGYNGGN